MKFYSHRSTCSVTRRPNWRPGALRVLALAAITTLGLLAPAASLLAQDTCPHCSMPIVQNSDAVDYQVVLRSGGKSVNYRCAMCAVADASRYQGEVTIAAPSETKGAPVVLRRSNGTWSSQAGAVFMAVPVSHRKCQIAYRAFHSRAGFDAYAAKNKDVVGTPSPMNLAQFIAAGHA